MKAVTLVTLVSVWFLAGMGHGWAATTTTTLTTEQSDREETTFGDLTTDALCAAAGTTIAFAPAALFQPGEIAPGPVTLTAVRALLTEPEEKWAVLELSGSQIRAALERSVSYAPSPRVYFLQVSGIKLVYDPTAPRGRKLKSVFVGSSALDDAARYEVAMPESLADGGAGYFTVFGDAPKIRTGTQGIAELIMSYAQQEETLSYTGQGRIVVGG